MEYNVIYIHTHDSGRVFSPYGYPVPTPRLQQFAEEACCFTNCYCASPTCSPSRSALLTGRYPHSNGMLGLANRGFSLRDYGQHLVGTFNRGGYTTALCGIQHEYGAYSDHAQGSSRIGYQLDLTADNTGMKEAELVQWDSRNVENAVQWLQAPKTTPFFLSMGFFSTHREYPVPTGERPLTLPAFMEDSPEVRADFAGHIESLRHFDHCFGALLDGVRAAGLYDNTIILFTTDHGVPFPMAKCTLFDAGIGVALLLRVPGAAANGSCCSQLVSQVDLAPTLCALAGLEPEPGYQGISLLPLLDHPEQPIREAVFAEVNFHTSYEPIRCVRTPRWKYIRYYDTSYLKYNLSNIDNSLSKDYYIHHGLLDGQKCEEALYDLAADPCERTNLAQNPAFDQPRQHCAQLLREWQRDTEDYLPEHLPEPQPEWRVNRPECTDPKSRCPEDFLNLMQPARE